MFIVAAAYSAVVLLWMRLAYAWHPWLNDDSVTFVWLLLAAGIAMMLVDLSLGDDVPADDRMPSA